MSDDLQTTSTSPSFRQAVSFGRSRVGAARRWVRHILTQERVVESIKTLVWVVPLTLLIWVYAEREQLARPLDPFTIPVRLVSADPTRVVTLLRPAEPVILANLEGPRAELDVLTEELSGGSGGVQALEISIDNRSPGTHEVGTKAILERNPRLAERGITVTNAQPPFLQIQVDEFREIDVPVVVPPSVTNLAAPPVFSPARVRLRAPGQQIAQAQEGGPLQAYAELGSHPELATPGTHELPAVRVSIPDFEDDNYVTVAPATVRAKLEVRQADEELTIPFMAVYALVPTSLWNQYRVEAPTTINNVKVIGPPEIIDLLKRDSTEISRPFAVLEVKAEDRPPTGQPGGSVRTRRLDYRLPSGVRVAPEEAQRTVDYKLVERSPEP